VDNPLNAPAHEWSDIDTGPCAIHRAPFYRLPPLTVLRTDLFDYDLPPDRIAQHPAKDRDASRLLVVHRETHRIEHRHFRDIADYLGAGDLLVRNTARVLPARLFARRPTGGAVECLLLRPAPQTPNGWLCLLRPGRRLRPGATFGVDGEFTARVVEKHPSGECLVSFSPERADESVEALAERLGRMPLPPYIARELGDDHADVDRDRYQTVFADRQKAVAVAAPTAGLHFTRELLDTLGDRGVEFADVILHVGLGTFRPIETEFVDEHPIHAETIEVPPPAARTLLPADHRRRIAVGTTSVRTLETFARQRLAGRDLAEGLICDADLYLKPPDRFLATDALITNFHMPRSTLLCLVAAFLAPGSTDGIAWLHEIYGEALREGYRFLSYGDAMLIL